MPGKNKQNDQRDKNKNQSKDTTIDTGRTTGSASDNNIGTVNKGNPSTVGQTKSNREVHTKNTVTGSDADGQAD
jgi:hypothetical protein